MLQAALRPLSLLLSFLVATSLLCFSAGEASAQDAARFREEIRQHQQRILELRKADTQERMAAELTQAANWLDESLVQVGKNQVNTVRDILRRVEVQLDFAASQINLESIRLRADNREEDLRQATAAHKTILFEIDQLTSQEKQLQDDITKVQKQ